MNNTFVYFALPYENTLIAPNLTAMLKPGETITSIALTGVTPVSDPPMVAALQSAITNPVTQIQLSGGVAGTAYGFQIQATTNARVLVAQVAVTVDDQQFVPYTTQNPEAYTDLVDEIQAGMAAIGTAVFSFPSQIDPRGGFVTWELLASDGTVYAAGNAYNYLVQSNGLANTVLANAVITVPSTVPASLNDQRYQLRYTLELPQAKNTANDPLQGQISQNTFFQFENVRVVGLNTVPLGTQSTVELVGSPAQLSLVTEQLYDNVTVELWAGGVQVVAPVPIGDAERTANGWFFAGVVDTSTLTVTLVPYTVIWKYWNSSAASMVFQESADLFVINPSMMTAITDVRSKINKAHTTLYGSPDMLYPNTTVMTWLRRGADAFNGAYGVFTNFSMLNALGVIREFWLMHAEMFALEAQVNAEAEKAFQFQGAAIQLDVDRTAGFDSAIQKIQSRLDNELKPLKQMLVTRGWMSGDGSQDPTMLAHGAIASVGITISPVTMWGRYGRGYGGLR
jgi:hypothetical protein